MRFSSLQRTAPPSNLTAIAIARLAANMKVHGQLMSGWVFPPAPIAEMHEAAACQVVATDVVGCQAGGLWRIVPPYTCHRSIFIVEDEFPVAHRDDGHTEDQRSNPELFLDCICVRVWPG